MIRTLYDWSNNFCCISVPIMAIAIDAVDGCGSSKEIRRQLQPKKTRVMLYQLLIL